jgi:type I restriction enzyme S subunit
MTSSPRYDAYRDTGIEWLGQIPAHWRIAPLKYLASFSSGGTPSKDNPAYWTGALPWASAKDLKSDSLDDTSDHISELAISHGGVTLEPAGSVLVLVRGMMLARTFPVVITRAPMAINQDLKALRGIGTVQNEFLAWLLRGTERESLSRIDEAGHGTKALRMEAWTSLSLCIPPPHEQRIIAAFLDRETAKIDALVEEQQRLVALLKEKRQAVISHAVTKGLDPNAPMKHSGIEWLGEVPAHWDISRLKRATVLLKDGTHLPPPRVSDGIPLLSVRNIESGRFGLRDDDSLISEADYAELSRAFVPMPNDVLLAIVGATLGKVALIPAGLGRFHIQRSVAILRSSPAVRPEWLRNAIASDGFQRLLWEHVGYSAQPGIYLGSLADFCIPVPPNEEQLEIAAFLTAETSKIDNLTAEAESAITLLQERRSAVISAAVTGKIDVRSLVPVEADAA